MPIEFTSDKSKKSRRTEERYQYLRYLFVAVIGSSAFLYLSFGYPDFFAPIAVSAVLLAFVEYMRTHSKKQEVVEKQVTAPSRKTEQNSRPSAVGNPVVVPTRRGSRKPEDILMIVAPACVACAVISIAAYQSFQKQQSLQLGNSSGATLDLAFVALFGVTCFALLGYVGILLWQRSRSKKESNKFTTHSPESNALANDVKSQELHAMQTVLGMRTEMHTDNFGSGI